MADKMIPQRKHRGAYSELVACAWLLSNGYEVFRNVSPHGIVDVIAMKDDEIIKLEIRTANYIRKDGVYSQPGHLSPAQIKAGVKRFVVYADGKCEIDWIPSRQIPSTSTCAECGSTFNPHAMRQVFCSKKCRSQNTQSRIANGCLPRQCLCCDKPFTPKYPAGIYCSKECVEIGSRAKVTLGVRLAYQRRRDAARQLAAATSAEKSNEGSQAAE